MIPVDTEARAYLFLFFVFATYSLFLLIMVFRALNAADRADRRVRRATAEIGLLTLQLQNANRALEHWKQTDRQRTAGWAVPTGAANTQLPQIVELPDRPNLRDDTGAIT